MVFLWFSYGFPMVFLWFSYGSHGFDLFDLWGFSRCVPRYAAPGIPMKSTLKQLGVSNGATLLALPVPRPPPEKDPQWSPLLVKQ